MKLKLFLTFGIFLMTVTINPFTVAAAAPPVVNPETTSVTNSGGIIKYTFAGGVVKPAVFPHSFHQGIKSCTACHTNPFIKSAGGNFNKSSKPDMELMIGGKFCGKCHSAVMKQASNSCGKCHK